MNRAFYFHGAAVSKNGCAIAFLAPTGGGKSTLTYYLNRNGFGYLTDDSFLYDMNSGDIRYSYKPIELREDGYNFLKKESLLTDREIYYDPTSGRERYCYYPRKIEGISTLSAIYLIERNSSINAQERVSISEGVRELMKSLMVIPEMDGEDIRGLRQMAKLVCGRLFYKDMRFVLDVINR